MATIKEDKLKSLVIETLQHLPSKTQAKRFAAIATELKKDSYRIPNQSSAIEFIALAFSQVLRAEPSNPALIKSAQDFERAMATMETPAFRKPR